MAFEVGQTVGDYEILELLGWGGMGRVYRVRNVISQRIEALKAIQPYTDTEPELIARFSAEIRTLAAFDHPNIAQLRTAFQLGNEQLMVMEFVEGSSLDKLAKDGALSQSEVVKIVLQVLSALSYAHSRGVVHRDIKPANVMVTPAGVVKLMDFGVAKSRAERHLTQTGSTVGSLYYMSPEQVRGDTVDGRSDLYSVGILLYELLSGQRPFRAETTHALLTQQLTEAPQPPVEINPTLPKAISDLILMALAKDPAQRFQTADAFAKALGSVANQLSATPLASTAFTEKMTEVASATGLLNAQAAVPQPSASPQSQATSSAVPPSSVRPPQPHSRPVTQTRNHRMLWILGGALTVIAVFVVALLLVPRFSRTAAMSKQDKVSQSSTETPLVASGPRVTPTSSSPSPTPPPIGPSAPVSSPGTQIPPPRDSAATAALASAEPQPPEVRPVGKQHTPSSRSIERPTEAPAVAAAAPPPKSPPPPPDQSVSVPPQVAQPAGPTEEEVAQAQDDLIKLNSRAGAVAGSLQRLQQQQAADGLGLRQDMAGAYSRMNGYLQAANNEVAQRNITAATRHMNLAEKEVSTLESFFNK